MNLDELRTFLEVVETGSLVAAAKRLNVTPSTVTARINGLEEEIGQAWGNEKYTSSELDKLRARYRELQAELIRTQAELQKKVLEVPAIQEKARQLDAAKKQAEELDRKVKEKTAAQK